MLKKRIDLDELCLDILERAGVDEWALYGSAMARIADNETNAGPVLNALKALGVEGWSGYSESLDMYMAYCTYLEAFGPEDRVKTYEEYKENRAESK